MLASLALALLAQADPAALVLGDWTAGGSRLTIAREDKKLVGRLAADGGGCPFPAGTEVFRGAILDDSLSAQVRLCLVAPTCGKDADNAFALLLVTKQLTGGVHTKAPCAVGIKSIVFRRPGQASMALTAPRPNERLSATPPPRPRANGKTAAVVLPEAQAMRESISAEAAPLGPITAAAAAPPLAGTLRNDEVAPGTIPGRPVGGPHAPDGQYDPRDARAVGPEIDKLLKRGLGQLERGEFERARKSFRDAIGKDPQRAEAYNGVGVTFYARGDLAEALAWYKRALEADARFGDAFYNMACAYALQGHADLAFRYLRLAALNGYAEKDQLEKDTDLASLRARPEWKDIAQLMSRVARP